ncbi:hypothetical protein [Dethiosulfatarculus sandiegensis]|uniref:4Fe-4S ferredoxin-type domain-containing protein n=1 Tax=Dethiosulfatarculus sandiegensis TaxID=1429043 RepID=A0A0D2GEC2_9BACT|nr:hypothetical protein [Dethiosulfatarculus sandiegensis]KIX13337.1 hypothetical protein X474_14045 [Dethiosulfatarculus sandiegensis]
MSPDTKELVAKALDLGAFAAGVVSVEDMLETSSSQYVREKALADLDLGSVGPDKKAAPHWRNKALSLLILAVAHPKDEPQLDYWEEGVRGGTRGNKILITINQKLGQWLMGFGINSFDVPYYPEKGGLYLKDAAVLAGLGVIGLNNLLLIPGLGAAHRLRALALKSEFVTSPATDYNPCPGCPAPCLKACPEKAFTRKAGDSSHSGPQSGYKRELCHLQMQKNIKKNSGKGKAIRFCRRCEEACPEAKV